MELVWQIGLPLTIGGNLEDFDELPTPKISPVDDDDLNPENCSVRRYVSAYGSARQRRRVARQKRVLEQDISQMTFDVTELKETVQREYHDVIRYACAISMAVSAAFAIFRLSRDEKGLMNVKLMELPPEILIETYWHPTSPLMRIAETLAIAIIAASYQNPAAVTCLSTLEFFFLKDFTEKFASAIAVALGLLFLQNSVPGEPQQQFL